MLPGGDGWLYSGGNQMSYVFPVLLWRYVFV